jgi:hypothetical protein
MSSEPVGSLAEEAAKLIAAVQGWAGEHAGPARDRSSSRDGSCEDADVADGGADSDDDDFGQGHEGHDLGVECRWCPLCQLARVAKATTPEVRDHLASAGLSLALALKGLLEGVDDGANRSEPVEKIDLDLDSPED